MQGRHSRARSCRVGSLKPPTVPRQMGRDTELKKGMGVLHHLLRLFKQFHLFFFFNLSNIILICYIHHILSGKMHASAFK